MSQNRMDWNLLVKKRIAKIIKQRNPFFVERYDHFSGFEFNFDFWLIGWFPKTQLSVFANQPYLLCIVGELAGGGSVAVGVVDR